MSTTTHVKDLLSVSMDGTVLPWEPADPIDPGTGGVDTANPLLNDDGSCAINPEWAESRYFGTGGSAVLASEGLSGRQTRLVHERHRVRRVLLTFSAGGGVDLELVRRALQVTRCGAGLTRFRHPMLDDPGDVASAPLVRFPAQTVKVERAAGGALARFQVLYEYVE